jgi:hypothetical protein
MIIIVAVVAGALGFGGGILYGRKNKKSVEAVVSKLEAELRELRNKK